MEVLVRGGYEKRFGETYIFRSKSEAIISTVNRLDPERCRECSTMPAPETSA